MKKLMYLIAMAAVLAFGMVSCEKDENKNGSNASEEGATDLFSVSADSKVRFSKGNLVYENGAFGFAPHQYDFGDYFGWGTGDNPTNNSRDAQDYLPYDEWGDHIAGGWRTLTKDEWYYLLFRRPNANKKLGTATVCGINGVVLLPDDWEGAEINSNYYDCKWYNVYDSTSWASMESDGAVFLPAAGLAQPGTYQDTIMTQVNESGVYWTSTLQENIGIAAFAVAISSCQTGLVGEIFYIRTSVRLVKDEND